MLKLDCGLISESQTGEDFEHYLYEAYVANGDGWKTKAYYFLKPAIPRAMQLALRQRYRAVQEAREFPAWPIEPLLVNKVADVLTKTVASNSGKPVYRLSLWPEGKRFCFVITHDVEWDTGLSNALRLADIEKRLGFISSWNIVPERYPIDWSIVDRLRQDGFEIGVHGLKHDGKLFQSHRLFQKRLEKIHEYASKWGATGFRSPSTLRNVHWMPELQFEYDSSFPDTDPYEPQPGGCCSIWPYFIDHLVELPLTMPQDHTLFEILGHKDISVWKKKADWIESRHGMVLINVHPDYMLAEDRLALYEEFLLSMKAKNEMWHALPREVARWWRDRAASTLKQDNGHVVIQGPAANRGRIFQTRLENGMLCDHLVPA